MQCPFCQSSESEVENSRPTSKGTVIWRRRKCTTCMDIFSTYESATLSYLIIEKRNGERKKYFQHKFFASIFYAIITGKRSDHGDAAVLAKQIVHLVEQILLTSKQRSITTSDLIGLTLAELKKKDTAACYRYAVFSSYRSEKFNIA